MRSRWLVGGAVLAASVFLIAAAEGVGHDIGLRFENQLRAESNALFGVGKPLEQEFSGHVARADGQSASDLVTLAKGLEASILTRNLAELGDMMAFWPNDEDPQWIIACIEGARADIDPGAAVKWNPGVQRISIDGSTVATILRGTDRCDGIRRTPWGSILATEETGTGAAWEINNPLTVTNYVITDRAAGTITDASGGAQTNVAKRTALPIMAWEGLAVLPSGVVIAGDELRPGDSGFDTDGGAIFKFIPTTPRSGGGAISVLTQSPLTAGSVWAMQVQANSNNTNTGQGAEVGNAAWVSVPAATARSAARTAGATGYYRPEDLHQDPAYEGAGIRFCWANTGNNDAKNYAEVMCAVDSSPGTAVNTTRSVVVNRWLQGDPEFNSFDNLDFQPHTGILYVIEDDTNGSIYACLPDGADRNLETDGCVLILTVTDQSAEPTGFIFDGSGGTAYVIIQHSADAGFAPVDGYQTDDLLKITGFKVK